MKEHLKTAVLMTAVTTLLLGVIYPLAITGLAQLLFPDKANGQMIERDGKLIGSRIIGQPFSGPEYFHPRPSAAGTGYDAAASAGSNLGPTNQALVKRVAAETARRSAENPGKPVPIDLVTASASGLDPHISPAAAEFQLARVAQRRCVPVEKLHDLLRVHTAGRQFGLGEPSVNVLLLNLNLDKRYPSKPSCGPA